jgi:hypothetical protein
MLHIFSAITGNKLSINAKFVLIFLLFTSWWSVIESKRAKNSKKKKNHDHTYGLWFILVLFLLTFVPLILYFLYNVYKDPLTPSLIKNGTEVLKEKTMGYLSKKKSEINKQS